MALSEYEFQISTDFTSLSQITDIKIDVLQQEIDNEPIITPPVHHILANIDDDNCIVYFDTELTTAEEDKLAEIIANHTGFIDGVIDPEEVEDKVEVVADINFAFADSANDYYLKFSSSSWKIGAQFIFSGKKCGTPLGCKIIAKGKGGIRIYDRSNGKILFEWRDRDFGNSYGIWAFTPFDNDDLPLEEAVWELQGNEEGSSSLYVSSLQLTYNPPITHREPPTCSSGGDDDDDDD